MPIYAANHDPVCISSHSKNFLDCAHDVADVSQLAMAGLPGSDVLWASVICTEISPAGHRPRHRGPVLLDAAGRPIGSERFARTRATAYDVMRACEVHRYRACIVENVVEFATRWELFTWWIDGMRRLGYRVQLVSANAAHVGDATNPTAPQLRDRLLAVFTLEHAVEEPDLALRPRSYCPSCRRHVQGVQTWSNAAAFRPIRVGKYGTQYTYICPLRGCGALVQPVVRPAIDVIDTADLGRRLRDRATTPKPATLKRLEAAVRYLSTDAVRRHHPGVPEKASGLRVAVLEYRNHCDAASGLEPFSTISAQGNHHGVVFAPPGYRPGEPLTIHDLTYRIISGREQAAAQRFPANYILEGTGADITRQAGNAVPPNFACWVGRQLAHVL